MKALRKAAVLALALAIAVLACGCTITNGTFTGMANSSTDTSLSASYLSFDGSLSRVASLKAGDKVTFSLEGGRGLEAVILKGAESVFSITDGAVFTASENGTYEFTLRGKAQNGSFALTWKTE